MATQPEAVRAELAVVTAAAASELSSVAAEVAPADRVRTVLDVVPLLVPAYYDAAGSLAVAWYDEIRTETQPDSLYVPTIIGDPATDWIEREVTEFARTLEADVERETQLLIDEATRLAEKEVARGFRDSITGNVRMDDDAIGWSRVARPGACKFCAMLADKGAVFTKDTAIFAAHKNCNCAARPEFANGEHGPEASVVQYVASTRRAKSDAAQAARNKRLRAYLNEHYPDTRG